MIDGFVLWESEYTTKQPVVLCFWLVFPHFRFFGQQADHLRGHDENENLILYIHTFYINQQVGTAVTHRRPGRLHYFHV